MQRRLTVLTVLLTLCALSTLAQTKPATKPHDYANGNPPSRRLEKSDAEKKPAKGGIVFVGSSTIVRWKTLATDFPEANIINHGFGGSEISDSTYYADRIIAPLEPKMVFLRAGTNDLHAGKSPEKVFQDYKDFVAKVRTKLPEAIIVFIGNCPAPSRWGDRDATMKLNQLVERYSKEVPNLKYVEAYDMSLDASGKVREDLFVADRLHLNPEGYKLLIERVRPFIPKAGDGK